MTSQQSLVRRQIQFMQDIEKMLKETIEATARIDALLANQPGVPKL